ncbi:hypothetical protein J7E32_12850 [Bacillus sp. ISL-55]|nr:hypothetical protein [Bacillus sp. ISL-55]
MPKLQYHVKMSHNQRLIPNQKFGFSRFFAFTKMSPNSTPLLPQAIHQVTLLKTNHAKKVGTQLAL